MDGCVRIVENENKNYTSREVNPANRIFIDDNFTDIDGKKNHGGGLYLNGSTIVAVIKRCIFRNCSVDSSGDYRGGAIYARPVNSIQTINTTIIDCGPAYHGGGVFLQNIGTCASLRMCVFEECKCRYRGGGVYLAYIPTGDAKCMSGSNVTDGDDGGGMGLVVGCSFTKCNSTDTPIDYRYDGGGLNWYDPPNQPLIRGCTFTQCSSHTYGGAILFRTVSQPGATSTLVHDTFFDGNNLTGDDEKYGYDVYVHRSSGKFSETPFVNTFSSRSANDRLHCNNSCTGDYADWLPFGIETAGAIYIDRSSGVDGGGCESMETKCKTIGYGLLR